MQGNIFYIALLPGQYLDIAWEQGQYPVFPGKGAFSYLLIHHISGYSEFTLLIDNDDFKCSSNGLNQY